MRTILIATMISCLAGVCLAQDKATFQGIQDRLAKALLAGDAKAAAALYTDNATLLPPGGPSVTGRMAIEAFWAARSAALADIRLTSGEIQSLGPEYVSDRGTLSGRTKADPSQTFAGKYVIIFKKSGATWLATTDIWNRDK